MPEYRHPGAGVGPMPLDLAGAIAEALRAAVRLRHAIASRVWRRA